MALDILLRGVYGTTIDLVVVPASGEAREVTVERTGKAMAEPRPEPVALLTPDIGYLDLTRFDGADPDALALLEGLDGIVIDLRGHGRGPADRIRPRLVAEPTESDHFRIPITSRPDGADRRNPEDDTWWLEPEPPLLDPDAVFLADETAISGSETFLGFVEQAGYPIVGAATAGSNGNVITLDVPGGMTVKVTALRTERRDGSRLHGVGIQPTHPVDRTIAGVAAGIDEYLQAGLQLAEVRARGG